LLFLIFKNGFLPFLPGAGTCWPGADCGRASGLGGSFPGIAGEKKLLLFAWFKFDFEGLLNDIKLLLMDD
jgi:hypothetical protein